MADTVHLLFPGKNGKDQKHPALTFFSLLVLLSPLILLEQFQEGIFAILLISIGMGIGIHYGIGIGEKQDDSNIFEILQKNIEKKEEYVLCSILGLQDEIAEYLINIESNIRNHQSDEHWILSFLEQKEETLEDKIEIKTGLIKLGFTSAAAQHLTKILTQNPLSDHQTVTYWAKRYIEQQFRYHILLSPQRSTPYNKDQVLDKEFNIETNPSEEEESVSIPVVNTNMMDEDELTNSQWLTEFLSQEGDTLEGTTYWFHGTDHDSAVNIMKNGIDLDRGKEGGDFSDGRGFYVTSDYKFAHRWPQRMMRKPTTAVVVFKLKNAVFTTRKGKEFIEDSKDWANAVGFFRNKKDFNWCGTKKKGKELMRFPYIFGPISKDGKDKKIANWTPKAREPKVFELCIKDELLGEEFYDSGHSIHKTIFFY